jgi:hypothetical protein
MILVAKALSVRDNQFLIIWVKEVLKVYILVGQPGNIDKNAGTGTILMFAGNW